MNKIEIASAAQIEAARPEHSTWVSANAGSGKTRVLTNRVARLLLAGCEPQKILCLTYTKAAAAEMQNRLFKSLGAWAMKSDTDLRNLLTEMGETNLTPERLKLARTLFARALETPGGLKIQTIHSFCAGILRRFPLEAGVSPQFQEMEDRQSKQLRAEIVEEIAIENEAAFDGVAWHLSGDDMNGLLDGILKLRAVFGPVFDEAALADALGCEVGLSDEEILGEVVKGVSDAKIDELSKAMALGGVHDRGVSEKILRTKVVTASEALDLYEEMYFTKGGQMRSTASFPTNAVKNVHPWVEDFMEEIRLRMSKARDRRLGIAALNRARDLHGFAKDFIGRYDARKARLGKLDFEDLIQKTQHLLERSNMAAWVLYRLDGGIDHILVDEAQDTSPAQWEIVRILAEEFHAGAEDRQFPRTIFVVGDEKQSIYSFQGADPQAFGAMRALFLDRLADVAQTLCQTELLYSFRSAVPVLELVDQVFTGDAREGLEGEILHRAVEAEMPGRVELWPFVEKPETPEETEWFSPVDSRAPDDPQLVLAAAIASKVASIIEGNLALPNSKDGPISAGDILILVQRRSALFHMIIKKLKEHGVPVAGADRLKIVEELAVKDLLALLQFLATPEDDLSLACALRSPLFGLTEPDLHALAQGRKGTLWAALQVQTTRWPEVCEVLHKLLAQADLSRPYDLLEQILTLHDGRRRLVARLGSEAEDGIDELLNQTLRYESVEAPLLTGFLGWITADEVEVKRQMDSAGDRVRVMTVHGAKGLEAPVVILPDTAKRNPRSATVQVSEIGGVAAWHPTAKRSPNVMLEAEAHRKRLMEEESRRLLYVALTRAANWLIVCGAGSEDKARQSWYARVEDAMQACGAQKITSDEGLSGETLLLSHNWQDMAVSKDTRDDAKGVMAPEYLFKKKSAPEREAKVWAPSDLGGAHALIGEGDDEATALKRGSDIHALLEVLPEVKPDEQAVLARRIVGEDGWQAVFNEAKGVLDADELQFVFAPDVLVEVPVTGALEALGGGRIFGRIDRLVVTGREVIAIDFKSNRVIPDSAGQTPEAILRQMGAYSAALKAIYPDKCVKTAIIWTHRAILMELSDKITYEALNRAAAS